MKSFGDRRTHLCLTLLGALAVSACGGAERSIPVASGSSAISRTVRSNTQLYVASSSPYFFNAYQLPLVNDEEPFASETGVDEPVALANDFRHLYVGSLDDGVIYTFDLPLLLNTASRSAARGRFVTPFARRHGPALRMRQSSASFLPRRRGHFGARRYRSVPFYVAGQGPAASEVLQYALPLRPFGDTVRFDHGLSRHRFPLHRSAEPYAVRGLDNRGNRHGLYVAHYDESGSGIHPRHRKANPMG